MAFILSIRFTLISNFFIKPIMAKHTFSYVFVLSISIPYETSILSYCSIFITHTDTHLNKFGDDIYCLVQKQI